MARVKKFKGSAVRNQLRHNSREIANPKNTDIDPTRSYQNYSLLSRNISDYDYFKKRKSEVYCYNREDVKVLAGWVVTAPKDLPIGEYEGFFRASHDFLCNRYGEKNCVQSIVHMDESGQPHLHWCFIPICADAKHGGEKICANNVITKKDLTSFHSDFQKFLNARGLHAKVKTGITEAQGGNRTVEDMKKDRVRLREQNRELPKIKINIKKQEVSKSRWDEELVRDIERTIKDR